MSSPVLPNRRSIQVCLRLDESPNEDVQELTTIQNTFDKSTSNYLLQSKHNQLSIKFQDKNNQTKDSINSSAENIKRLFKI